MSIKFNLSVVVLFGAVSGSNHMNDGIVALVADHLARQPHVVQHSVPFTVAGVRRDVKHAAIHKDNDLTAGIGKLGDLNKAVLQ